MKSWARRPLLTLHDLWNFLFQRKMIVVAALAGLLLLSILWPYVSQLLVMAAFIALGTVSMLYQKFIKVSLGFELNMLGIVVTSTLYGPLAGIIVGCTAFFVAMLLTGHLMHASFVSFGAIALVALLVPLFESVTMAGIVLTVLYDLIIAPLYLYLGSSPARTALFVATHIPFNVWVFTVIAPHLV